MSVFLIPKGVLEAIEKKRRQFLWYGQQPKNKPALLNKNLVCTEKKLGGLGLKNLTLWNIATLWIRWVFGIYLAESEIWTYHCKLDCKLYWRKLMEVRDTLKTGFVNNSWGQTADGNYTISSVVSCAGLLLRRSPIYFLNVITMLI